MLTEITETKKNIQHQGSLVVTDPTTSLALTKLVYGSEKDINRVFNHVIGSKNWTITSRIEAGNSVAQVVLYSCDSSREAQLQGCHHIKLFIFSNLYFLFIALPTKVECIGNIVQNIINIFIFIFMI